MNDDDRLERLLHATLRGLPARPAPHDLESRVHAELARRAAQTWPRRSFRHWPMSARAGFVATCGILAAVALLSGSWMEVSIRTLIESDVLANFWVRHLTQLGAAAGDLAVSLANALPAAWLDTLLAVAASLYVCLFGLGAAAYRFLYLRPVNDRLTITSGDQ
ncbi:MAG: hypothetical protein WB440_00265 [Steroidobacteraceae bacterium]|jgi:hypothetical protein